MKPKPTTDKIQLYIVKRGERILGTFHTMDEAKQYRSTYEVKFCYGIKAGITIEFGGLEEAEVQLAAQRKNDNG